MPKRLLEHAKSVLILLLTLSAAFLLLETGTYFEKSGVGLWDQLRRAVISAPREDQGIELKAAAIPVRIAVCNADGRYGVQYEKDTTDKLYADVNSLLAEALGSAKQAFSIAEQEWRNALSSEGVYFDFLGPVPLRALSAWLSGSQGNAQLNDSARRILVAAGENGAVFLYYINESDGMFYACETSGILTGRLAETLSGYMPNGASFAFEEGKPYEGLDPYTMLLSRRPVCAVLNASNPLAGEDIPQAVLTALDFNPYPNFTYSVSGEQVVREGTATLRIAKNGKVTYHGGDDEARLRIEAEGEEPTEAEIIEGARRLAEKTVGAYCADARLYLIGMEQTADGSFEVRFGYCFEGAAVQLYEKGYAASILVSGGRVTDCTLYFRSYDNSETTVTLMPELQALAVLKKLAAHDGRLLAGYVDNGEDTLNPEWVYGGKISAVHRYVGCVL